MNRGARTWWLLLVCGSLAGPAGASDRALLVGVGAYRTPGADLPGIDKDLASARRTAHLMGFRDQEILVLADGAATLAGIRAAFRDWLYQAAAPDDRALFYFSGHGSYLDDESGDETDHVDEVLLPHDFAVGRNRLENVLVDDELGELLDGIGANRVYVFLDSCHSGTATRELGGGEYVAKFFAYEGMPQPPAGATRGLVRSLTGGGERHMVMTASTETERALASPIGGLFTLGVEAALDDAATRGGPLAPRELREVVESLVARVLEQAPSRMFHPQVYGPAWMLDADLLAKPAPRPEPAATTAPPPAPPVSSEPSSNEPSGEPPTLDLEPPSAPPTVAEPASGPEAPAPEPLTLPDAPSPPAAPPEAHPPGPTAPTPAASAPPGGPDLEGSPGMWARLEALVDRASYPVAVHPHRTSYRVGEELVLEIDVPSAGYLNVLSVGEGDVTTVLFPNRYRPDNHIPSGQTVTIPGPGDLFTLPAELASGVARERALLVVVHTKHPVSAYDAGTGEGFLRTLSDAATRAFVVAAAPKGTRVYGAGRVALEVRP